MTQEKQELINALKTGVDKFKQAVDGAEKLEPDWDAILTEEEKQYVLIEGAYLGGMLRGQVDGINIIRSQIIGGMGMPLYGIHFEKKGQQYNVAYDMNQPLEVSRAYLYTK